MAGAVVVKLLFVCLGNICRSPAAENIMNHLLEAQNLKGTITCDSAGTAGYHVGSPPDRRMREAAQRQGMTFTGAARQLTAEDLQQFDLILAMDRSNYRDILSLDPGGAYHHKVKMMCSYCTHHQEVEVPDPYYGGTEGFNHVIDLLQDACTGLLQTIAP
ncbi:MAG: low molecular weight phosphotyrosine protein phosphatase [Oscillatoriales cyanobacterium SM2_2_1]|nr:low molecular weight phosphotyrosine protein phosphatase [Oscillatoriales cyanobacterium SM2_2_1]